MNHTPFLDTNILLYAFDETNSLKYSVASKIVLSPATISTQVINETCSNLIRKFKFTEDAIQKFVESSYKRYTIVNITQDVFLTSSKLREKYSFSYYDSNIVAAALLEGCTILYSEDMQHQQIIENRLTIINPFAI